MAQKQRMESELLTAAGEMAVRRKTDAGKLVYAWNDLEVEVSPRNLREPLLEGQSSWKRARARETTPERALRKMKRKVQLRLSRAAKGEHERIVVPVAPAKLAAAGSAQLAEEPGDLDLYEKCPALKQLNDPAGLTYTREAYQLSSAH